jgi:glycosyltransferase involved in cell wall biosynthesis
MTMQRPIRVCFLIDRLRPAGTESQLLTLVRGVDRAAVEPYLCLLDGQDELSRSLEPDGCPVLRLGIRSLSRWCTLGQCRQFARFLRERRIDVLQVYFPDSTYFGTVAGRLAGIPRVVRVRNNLGYWLTPLHRLLARVCGRLAAATLTNSEVSRQLLVEREGLDPRRVAVIENGVDLDRFMISPPGVADSPPCRRVGIVANLRPVKALDVFIHAANAIRRALPGTTFHIAGEGESRPELERLAAACGLRERVHFEGSVRDVPAFLGTLDVAVLCSHSESLSNALLEYMASGKAVVATSVGGNITLIRDGVDGILVPPGDPAVLAEGVLRLLRDRDLAGRLGSAARRKVREYYSIPAMLGRYVTFYRNLMEGANRAYESTEPAAPGTEELPGFRGDDPHGPAVVAGSTREDVDRPRRIVRPGIPVT